MDYNFFLFTMFCIALAIFITLILSIVSCKNKSEKYSPQRKYDFLIIVFASIALIITILTILKFVY